MKALGALVLLTSLAVGSVASAQAPRDTTSIAVIVRITTSPLLQVDGSPAPDRDRELQALAAALDALAAPDVANVPIAIAPSAVMCDELMRLRGNVPKRFLRSLRKLAARATVLDAPFANVRLVDVAPRSLRAELDSGRDTLTRCTGSAPSSIVYPPGLVVDDASANAASAAGVPALITTAVGEPVKQRPDLLPVIVARANDTPATLVARRPSRAFAVSIDASSDPAAFVRAIASDASISATTIAKIDEAASDVGHVGLGSAPSPPASYRHALLRADASFAGFAAMTLKDNPLTAAYRDVLARARSSADLAADFAPGRRLADQLITRVADAMRRIDVGVGSITFTSRRGSVPVTVNDRNSYPVRVRIDVASPKLDFPSGTSRVVTVGPPGDTTTFAAVARSTGTFPVVVSLRTPDGALLSRGDLTVRSTAANLPALAVTIAGFVGLVVFYTRRKRKRAPV